MTKKKVERCFELFAGEMVQVILDKDVEQTSQKQDSINIMKTPLIVQGFMIEEDDDFIYLGYEPEQISQAVKKSYIIHIEVGELKEGLEEIMDIGDLPKSDKGYN